MQQMVNLIEHGRLYNFHAFCLYGSNYWSVRDRLQFSFLRSSRALSLRLKKVLIIYGPSYASLLLSFARSQMTGVQ